MFGGLFRKKKNEEPSLEGIEPMGDLGDYPAKHLLEILERQKMEMADIHERDRTRAVGLDNV